MKKNKTLRRIISAVAVLAVIAGAMFGARALIDHGRKIPVTLVANIADMWYDTGSSGYGQISQGGVQQVWNDSGKLVSKVYVSAGDKVSKGDPLVQYDISEARLEADNCRILYEMAKRDLNKAQERLEYIKTFRPNERPEPIRRIFEEPVDLHFEDETLVVDSGEASVEEVLQDGKAFYIININTYTPITRQTFEAMLSYESHMANPEPDFEDNAENDPEGDVSAEETLSEEPVAPKNFCFRIWANCADMDSVQIATVTPTAGEAARVPIQGWFAENGWLEEYPEQETFFFSDVYTVDEITGNVEERTDDLIGKVFVFKLERSNAQVPETERYSQREIDNMIREQNDLIRGLKIDVAQAELNWRQAKQASGDGIVRAAHDGIVMSVGDPYNSYEGEPFIQVGSGEGYQIVSTITELQLGTVKVGDTITVNMWSNGMTYSGTIVKISPYPTDDSMSYYGGGNVSNYQFIADLECEDELQTWDGGEVILDSASGGEKGLFALQAAYVREDGGRNYVLKVGEDGRVYRQYVETGKVIYGGWHVEIISGLTLDDYIAFPYGKNAVEGAKADYDSEVGIW
jgi:multidrug resistance efflux pump